MAENTKKTLKEYVRLTIEARKRGDVQISTGSKVPWGSREHILDLERRIDDLAMWRNASPRSSDKRANFQRLVIQLRNELRSAQRYADKQSALIGS